MGEWRNTTLGEVLALQRGFDLPETERRVGPYAVIGSTGLVGTHDRAMVQGPGVVIGGSGSLGGGQFIKGDFWPLDTTLWVKDFKGNNRRFCYYLLKFLDLAHFNTGSSVPTLNRNHIHPLPVTVPTDPCEQRAIAHILGTLDDKIELNRRISETLEAMARVLFNAWFVDFEPVRAKTEGRWQRGRSLPGLPAHFYDLFPDRLVPSELGEIPEGWEVGTLNSLADIEGGKQLPSEERKQAGTFPVFGANGIMGYAERVTHDGLVIAFGRVGAYCGSVHWTYGGAWINNNASSVVPKRWPEFVMQTMLESNFEGMRIGSAQPFIPNTSLASLQIVRPSNEVLDRFCIIAQHLRIMEHVARTESRTLAALRDALLPKLISGALRVKNPERFIEANP